MAGELPIRSSKNFSGKSKGISKKKTKKPEQTTSESSGFVIDEKLWRVPQEVQIPKVPAATEAGV